MPSRRLPLLAATAMALVLVAGRAGAVGEDEASANVKGVAGGAMLGAEAVLLTEAALDVEPAWAYIAGGAGGAVAGGVGGYFVEKSDDARLSLFLLAGGMALVIPTIVAVLSATAYEPPADYIQDQPPFDEPIADPPRPVGDEPGPTPPTALPPAGEGSSSAPRRGKLPVAQWKSASHSARQRHARFPSVEPPALLGWRTEGFVSLNLPALELRDVFTAEQVQRFGVRQRTELRLAVLSVVF